MRFMINGFRRGAVVVAMAGFGFLAVSAVANAAPVTVASTTETRSADDCETLWMDPR
jgi:hypothetical protein